MSPHVLKVLKDWTPEEDVLLKRLFIDEDRALNEVCESFPCRSRRGVHARIFKLRLLKGFVRFTWSEDDDRLLKECFAKKMEDKEIAALLGKSKNAVASRRKKYGLWGYELEGWSEEATNTLIEMTSRRVAPKEIALAIGTTERRVKTKMVRMGIKYRKWSDRWTGEECKRMIDLFEAGKTIVEVAALMERGVEGVIDRCKKLKVYKSYPGIRQFEQAKMNVLLGNPKRRYSYMLRLIRDRAKLKGYEYNLTMENLEQMYTHQNGRCYYSGIPMTFATHDESLASVDRVDSNRGYTVDNVVLTASIVNLMKRDLSVERFTELCGIVHGHQSILPPSSIAATGA